MKISHSASSKSSGYGVGALIALITSLGIAAIVYSLILQFDLLILLAWIFGPLGVYTLAYSIITRKNSAYYLIWGSVMVAIAFASLLYTIISPFAILGILAIVIAIMGIFAYQKSRK